MKTQEKEYRTRLKSLIVNTAVPQIPDDDVLAHHRYDLSEFYLREDKKKATPSLGAAFILDAISISFLSDVAWDFPEIAVLGTWKL